MREDVREGFLGKRGERERAGLVVSAGVNLSLYRM